MLILWRNLLGTFLSDMLKTKFTKTGIVLLLLDMALKLSFLQKYMFLLLCYIPCCRMHNTCKNNDGLK